jgi:2-polyprenyl-3-methyl-5-hydroxy-6-metoxy-1,4-benzoquinol methylase
MSIPAQPSMRVAIHQSGRLCSEEQLFAGSDSCPLCGFAGNRKSLLHIQRSPIVLLLTCPQCKGASASRMPKPDVLTDYYSQYYEHETSHNNVTFYQPQRFAKHILRLMAPVTSQSQSVRILDFGGGDAALSLAIAEQLAGQTEQVDIDLVDFELGAAVNRAGVSLHHGKTLADVRYETYDIVLASAVMEHLPDPSPALTRLFSLIGSGGHLYARTPWMAPILGVAERLGLNFDFTFPGHVHDMGKHYWENVCRHIPVDQSQYSLRHSAPSVVETGFDEAPLRTITAHLIKAPSRLWSGWSFVGGWEVVYQRGER